MVQPVPKPKNKQTEVVVSPDNDRRQRRRFSFRATGITNYLANGGNLDTAAAIAGHASTQTTQLYNRNLERINQAELERIRF